MIKKRISELVKKGVRMKKFGDLPASSTVSPQTLLHDGAVSCRKVGGAAEG